MINDFDNKIERRAMPSIDALMEVWPQEFEELVKEVSKCVR